MQLTIGTASYLRTNYASILERTMDVLLSSVVRCNLMENLKILNRALESFDKTRDMLIAKYGKDGTINPEDDPESYSIVEKELTDLMAENIEVNFNIMSLTYEETLKKLEMIDVPITQRELMSLELICKGST